MDIDAAQENAAKIEMIESLMEIYEQTHVFSEIFTSIQSFRPNDIKEYYSSVYNSALAYFHHNFPIPSSIRTLFDTLNPSFSHYGCFPEIQRFYAIMDQNLFFWTTKGEDLHEFVSETEQITAVCLFEPELKFFTSHVSYLLAVSTLHSLKVYPIISQTPIRDHQGILQDFDYLKLSFDFSVFYHEKIDLPITSMCAGPPGTVYLGTLGNQIYQYTFEAPTEMFEASVNFDTLSSDDFIVSVKNFINEIIDLPKTPIIKMCFDPTTSRLLYLNENGTITVFNVDSESYNGSWRAPPGEKIIAISPVTKAQSKKTRFICFNDKGVRYILGKSYIWNPFFSITLRAQRPPPVELQGKKVIDAGYSFGFTYFITADSIVILKACTIPSFHEIVSVFPLESTVLSSSIVMKPQFSSFNPIFKAPALYQYVMEPPSLYLLSSNESFQVSFQSTLDNFLNVNSSIPSSIFEKNSDGQFNDSFFRLFFDDPTSLGTLGLILLAATRSSRENRTKFLLTAISFADLYTKKHNNSTNQSPQQEQPQQHQQDQQEQHQQYQQELQDQPQQDQTEPYHQGMQEQGQHDQQGLQEESDDDLEPKIMKDQPNHGAAHTVLSLLSEIWDDPDLDDYVPFSNILEKESINVTDGFLYLTARCLGLIWNCRPLSFPLFFQPEISRKIKQFPKDHLFQLRSITETINEYIHMCHTALNTVSLQEKEELIHDEKILNTLKSFLNQTIEEFRFLQIIGGQSADFIHSAYWSCGIWTRLRLKSRYADAIFFHELNFLNSNSDTILMSHALRVFASYFFLKLPCSAQTDALAFQIARDCPTFACSPNIVFQNAMNQLELASTVSESTRYAVLATSEQLFLSLISQLNQSMQSNSNPIFSQNFSEPLNFSDSPIFSENEENSSSSSEILKRMDMNRICGDYIRFEEPQMGIRIVLALSDAIDPHHKAFSWLTNGADPSDELGKNLYNTLVEKCFQPIQDSVFSEKSRSIIEDCQDRLFLYHIFQYLIECGDFSTLFDLNSDYLEPFLRKYQRQYLYQYYEVHNQPTTAANELLLLATKAAHLKIEERANLLRKCINLAKAGLSSMIYGQRALAILKEAEAALHCLSLQEKHVDKSKLTSSEDNSNSNQNIILDYPNILQNAIREENWEAVLEIEAMQYTVDEKQKKEEVQKIWKTILEKEFEKNPNPDEISYKIQTIIRKLPRGSSVISAFLLVPVFEEFKAQHGFPLYWAAHLLRRTIKSVFDSYSDMILNYSLDKDTKYEFVVIAMKILENGNLGSFALIERVADELLHDTTHPLFNEADQIMKRLEG